MKTLFVKLRDFLKKDTGEMNESTKLRYVIRIIISLSILFNFIGSIGNTILSDGIGIGCFAGFFMIFLIVLALSYFLKTKAFLVIFNVSVLSWISALVVVFGWGSGAQAILIVLLVLSFFSSYNNYFLKLLYAIFLFLYRILMYEIARNSIPVYPLPFSTEMQLQILTAAFGFASISTLCYIFSRDSQELEGKLVEYNVKLVNQANTDPLTGLNNRRKTMEYLESLMSDGRVTGICVSICDIDFFKKVNDTYGHDIGDKVLKSIAQTMVNSLSEDCFISRWGGEEFLIVFPNHNGDEAYVMLQDLRTSISRLKFEVKDRSFKVTMTYGLAEYDFHSDILSFVKEADNKLYIGKENGRDQVVF